MRKKYQVPLIDEKALTVFTDGSSFSSPRRGGIGALIIYYVDYEERKVAYNSIGYLSGTNNQMELQAVISILDAIGSDTTLIGTGKLFDLSTVSRIIVYTDSQYVANNFGLAAAVWSHNRWHNNSGKPVDNAAQWKELLRQVRKIPKQVEVKWHPGHTKSNPNNAIADKLARESAQRAARPPIEPVIVRRKKTSNKVDPGSVGLVGQRLSIYVISSKYMRVHKIDKIRYQVVSKKSEYLNLVDFAYTDIPLRPAHSYYVQFNADNKNPRIIRRFRELKS